MPDHCYCALCGGSLDGGPDVGNSSKGPLNRRRRRVAKKREALTAGRRSFDSLASLSDHPSDHYSDDEPLDYDLDNEWEGYDPELITEEKVEWLQHVRALGVHRQLDGDAEAFITNEGFENWGGDFIVELDSAPNQPGRPQREDYDLYEESRGKDVVIPFHPTCMSVLEKAHEWYCSCFEIKEERLDLVRLYDTSLRLASEIDLGLDYGGICGPRQFWESLPGEEYAVINPLDCLPDTLTIAEQTIVPFRNRATIDPFQALPNEVIHMICHYLPGNTLPAFLTASVTVYYATVDQGFWRSLCRLRLPWVWEAWPEGQLKTAEKIDYKKLYLCLEKYTSQPFGMTVPTRMWMGMANRRRIWNACVELLGHYGKGPLSS